MTYPETVSHDSHSDSEHDTYSKTVFGFWLFLLTDFMLFATIFVMYAVLHDNTFGGPSAKELFSLPHALTQTLILLVSSLTVGLGGISAHRKHKGAAFALFGITFLLGIAFMAMEFSEFIRLLNSGESWHNSAFLSSYFTLVGTHAFHMLFGLLWFIVLLLPVLLRGLTDVNVRRLTCLRMYWQFLNVVWIFIFTVVYLLGAI
jgi:cytochrome o ubiquinol oxidase subunit III